MQTEIIERHVVGKISPERCEDVIHVSKNFIAVIDGATSYLCHETGKAPGKVIAEIIDHSISELSPALPSQQFHIELSLRVGDELSRKWPVNEEVPTASLITYSVAHSEVWILGDGWVSAAGHARRFSIPFADAYTLLRCTYLHSLIQRGMSIAELRDNDRALELILPFIRVQKHIQNTLPEPYGYGVLDGRSSCSNYVKIMKIRSGDEVILASDGYPVIAKDLRRTEELLQRIIEEDPLMISKYKQVKGVMNGQKSFDDRAFVRFRA